MSVWGPKEIRRRCEAPWNYRWFGSHPNWVWGWTLSSVSKPKDSRCFQLLSHLSGHLTLISRTQLSNRVGRPKSPPLLSQTCSASIPASVEFPPWLAKHGSAPSIPCDYYSWRAESGLRKQPSWGPGIVFFVSSPHSSAQWVSPVSSSDPTMFFQA